MVTKKERERRIFDLFIENYKSGKINLLREQESPDFIVSLGGKKIGVELTEIFQDSHLGVSQMKQESSFGNQFTEELISLIQPHISFTFSIGIRFNKSNPIKKSKKHEVLIELGKICVVSMINLENHEHLELENYYDSLPAEIDYIRIRRFDGMVESIDSRPESGTISTLTIHHLNKVLENKETKLSSYDVLDQQWLLIREGNYYSGSFGNVEIESPIESLFDKVLLFRTRTKEIIELK